VKKMPFLKQFIVQSLLFYSFQAIAQIDPTTSLLVRPVANESEQINLDSSRYTVKSQNHEGIKPQARETVKPAASVIKQNPNKNPAEKPSVVEQSDVKPVEPPLSSAGLDQRADSNVNEKIKTDESYQFDGDIDKYKSKLDPDDVRRNLVEISVAPNYLYLNSSSSFWTKKYYSSGPGISVAADIWITPLLGINVSYLTTLSADMSAQPNTSQKILVDHRYTDFGFVYRNYASLNKLSKSINLGIKYSEYQLIIPKSENTRWTEADRGIALTIAGKFPQVSGSDWVVFADMLPRIKIVEEKKSASVKSGTGYNSYGFKFGVGEDYILNRHNQLFWRISHRINKTIFSGSASDVDPTTGATPSGVSMTQGVSLFEFGYRWGD
jgi:hypothetical protein